METTIKITICKPSRRNKPKQRIGKKGARPIFAAPVFPALEIKEQIEISVITSIDERRNK